jgi:2-succinyl-5-enolpyruvyl-6-hydroxy-3-cyclohexene-1-carboxylate synthase
MAMIDSESGKFTVPELPDVRIIKRYMQWDEWDAALKDKKVMLVIGEHRPFTEKQKSAIECFCESYNIFVYTNHLSNYYGKYSLNANIVLATEGLGNNKPDILITIGGQTGDYPLYGSLVAGDWYDFEHWRVSEEGSVVDTYDKLTKIFECPLELFFTRLANETISDHSYFEQWKDLLTTKVIPTDLPFSNPYLAQQLHDSFPKGSFVNFAILNSLRSWSFFPLDPSIICYSNVAAFGIDGCMSVLLGQSINTDQLCFMVIGDLSFFYDMNSLGIRHIKNNVRILLVNNKCGAEFKLYSNVSAQFGSETNDYIAAAGHNGSAKGWAEATGFKYLCANNKEEFIANKSEFLSESDKSIVFEIFTTPEDESNALKTIRESNRVLSATGVIKNTIRSIIGNKGVEIVKSIIK